jgi:transposase
MGQKRKRYTSAEKVAILRRHLLDNVAISDVCQEFGIQPTQFYRWQKEFFENGAAAFETRKQGGRRAGESDAAARKIEALESKLQEKNEVLAELMGEHVALKKTLGQD